MASPHVFHVNGRRVDAEAHRDQSLLAYLRDSLGLTGAKYGCGEGQCGACTVLVDDRAIRSCVTPVASLAGKRVVTIEGLAPGDGLHPVQQAFLDADALQCGYCTPGMILAAVALLREQAGTTTEAIARGLKGNVCRCGTYPRIIEAVRLAARTGGKV